MISASFLSIHDNLETKIKALAQTKITYLHVDVMDGLFVPKKTWRAKEVEPFVKDLNKPLDVHLMVNDLKTYIDEYALLKPAFITFHLEATNDPQMIIDYIHTLGLKAGIALKPATSLEALKPYLPSLDLVLIMSVEPGAGGQSFLNNSLYKIDELAKMKAQYHYVIEVDGGINDQNIALLKQADLKVVGSYITNSSNYEEQVNKLIAE